MIFDNIEHLESVESDFISSLKNKIYADSEEKYLKRVIVYEMEVSIDDRAYWYDKEYTRPVYAEDALELFLKGHLAIASNDDEALYIPTKAMLVRSHGDPVSIEFMAANTNKGFVFPYKTQLDADASLPVDTVVVVNDDGK